MWIRNSYNKSRIFARRLQQARKLKKAEKNKKKVLTKEGGGGIISERLTGGQEKEGNGQERPGGSRTDF